MEKKLVAYFTYTNKKTNQRHNEKLYMPKNSTTAQCVQAVSARQDSIIADGNAIVSLETHYDVQARTDMRS